jgi:uncharacterized membrane protein
MRLTHRIKEEFTWLKLSYKFLWAHHPTCDPYSNQRFDFLGISLCQGCTLITLGGLVGFVSSLILRLTQLIVFGGLFVMSIILVITIDGFSLGRPFKRVLRHIMGLTLGVGLTQLVLQPWLIKLGLVISIFLIYYVYRLFRRVSPSKDLCQSCHELENAPNCSGMIDKIEANKRYQELVLPVLENDFIKKLERKAAENITD